MNRWVICAVLSLVVLEVAGNGVVNGASDGGPQNADTIGSSGSVSMRPVGDSSRGEELYNASCIVCHKSGATGGLGPRLAGNPVLSNEHAFWKVVYEGRHVMPPLKGAITEQQMADIQAWLKTLR
ncbi:MAG: cytochrome c [Nitrospira sp.]|nr:cytochrome c [Nitrospira sp.]